MRTLTRVLLLLLCLNTTQAQGTYPLQIGNLWQYRELPNYYVTDRAIRDTMMPNGNTYTVISGATPDFLRQAGTRVYSYQQSTNNELLLYDFSRRAGDTVAIWYFQTDTVVTTVMSYSVGTFFGRSLNTWTFNRRWLHSSLYGINTVADNLGLVGYSGEVFGPFSLTGAIINGAQYGVIVNVDEHRNAQPTRFALEQNYPNPFNPTTNIEYQIPNANQVALKVFDVLGREVARLVNEVKQPGTYTVQFDGSDLTSGVYFYRLIADEYVLQRKMLLLR
jgi:hypothetical protein